MKNVILVLCFLFPFWLTAQNDTVKLESKIIDVTVFYQGAQITRNASLNLPKGSYVLVVKKLPRELDESSIQVKGIASCQILSVKSQMQQTTLNDVAPLKEIKKSIEDLEDQFRLLNSKLAVFDKEEKLLWDNRQLSKSDKGLTPQQLKEGADFYRSRLNEINQESFKVRKEMRETKDRIQELQKKQNQLLVEYGREYKEIIICIDCDKNITSSISFSYLVKSAGWTPGYDFRVEEVTEPITISYNAKIFQNTGEDWKQVKLKLSGSDPLQNSMKPELYDWILEQNNQTRAKAKIFKSDVGALKGKVIDKNTLEPIPFANILVLQNKNQLGGTTTDIDGNFTLKPLPPGIVDVKITYVGYKPMVVNNVRIFESSATFQEFKLEASTTSIEVCEVVDYKIPLISKDQPMSGETISGDEINSMPGRSPQSIQSVSAFSKTRYSTSKPLQTTDYIANNLQQNITSQEFQIDAPYSILSDGRDYQLRIKDVKAPSFYYYLAIPKADPDPFLICNIPDWHRLNLAPSNYNIYFKGTFVGESVINTDEKSDTLQLSLGRDKNLFVSRTRIKEQSDKKMNDNTVRETQAWNITVKNTRKVPVHFKLEDQYPTTQLKNITINLIEAPDAIVDPVTGKLKWDFTLNPNDKKEFKFIYSVKYPRVLQVE